MDTDWIKQKTYQEGLLRYFEISPGRKISWPAQLLHHYCQDYTKRRIFTALLDLELPPSALFQDALDKMIKNETLLLKIGFAIVHPEDNFCKKTGRELALKNMGYYHFDIDGIYNCDLYVKLILSLSSEQHPKLTEKIHEWFEIRVYRKSGMVVLC